MILSSIFFLLIFMAIFYNLILPSFCNNITLCRIWDEPSSTAYQIFSGVIVLIMLLINIFQALNCPSLNTSNNILLAAASTFACWLIFVFVVYTKEYFRMSFANVFGYIAMYSYIGKILPLIVNPNVIETGILQSAIQQVQSGDTRISNEELGKLLTNEMIKIPIKDNFQLLSFIRSGTNFIYSLMFLSTYTNVYFKTDIQNTLDSIKPLLEQLKTKSEDESQTPAKPLTPEQKETIFKNIAEILSQNKLLLELLNTLY